MPFDPTSAWQTARPMQEPMVVRQGGMWVALLAASQFLAPPLLVVGSLYVSGLIHGLPFESQYLSLALVAGAGALSSSSKLPTELAAQSGTRDPGVVLTVLGSWTALVVMLLLIGYVTKTSDLFSRRVMLTWFVLTPMLLLVATAVLRWGLSHFMAIQGTRRAVVAGYDDVAGSFRGGCASACCTARHPGRPAFSMTAARSASPCTAMSNCSAASRSWRDMRRPTASR